MPVDEIRKFGYPIDMVRHLRVLMILMLAAFAAGTVAHAASAVAMDAKMALGAVDSADMGGCEGCSDSDGDMPPCDNVCVSPVLAVVPSAQAALPGITAAATGLVADSRAGPAGPPEPYPPRSLLLS